jgi:hypothetical protein
MIETLLILCAVFFTSFAVSFLASKQVYNRWVKAGAFAAMASVITSLVVLNSGLVSMRFAWSSNLAIIGGSMLFFNRDFKYFQGNLTDMKRSGVMLVAAFAAQIPLLGIYESFSGAFTIYQSANVSWYYACSFGMIFIPIGLIGNVISGEMYMDYLIGRKTTNARTIQNRSTRDTPLRNLHASGVNN